MSPAADAPSQNPQSVRSRVPLSVLDLSPIPQGSDARTALLNTRDLAQHVERWGYRRFWLAEHHNMSGIASAATSVAIGWVAGATSTLLVGSGGVMLPNHAPLVIAEQFGTLASLYPGRIELGIGRAPGTDPITAHALRRTLQGDINEFPRDVMELQNYFRAPASGQRVLAVPGAGLNVPIWILGSSLYGAQLAAALGLPYAFASHFAAADLYPAIETYRRRFEPSEQLSAPYVMLGMNVCAADTEEEARYLRSSSQQSFLNLRRGRPGPLPPPVRDFENSLGAAERQLLGDARSCSSVGTGETVRRDIDDLVERTGADEIIVTSHIYDHAARLRSFEITARAWSTGAAAALSG